MAEIRPVKEYIYRGTLHPDWTYTGYNPDVPNYWGDPLSPCTDGTYIYAVADVIYDDIYFGIFENLGDYPNDNILIKWDMTGNNVQPVFNTLEHINLHCSWSNYDSSLLDISPDGTKLVYMNYTDSSLMWVNPNNGNEYGLIKTYAGNSSLGYPKYASWSPDGSYLVFHDSRERFWVWDGTNPPVCIINENQLDVVLDATSTKGDTTGDSTWSHSGALSGIGGVLVNIVVRGTTTNPVSVTYGGEAMTKIRSISDSTGEPGNTTSWWRANPLQGTQTIAVDVGATHQWAAMAYSYLGTDLIYTTGIESGDVASPSEYIGWTGTGVSNVMAVAMYTGHDDVATNVTAGINLTKVHEVDFGTSGAAFFKSNWDTGVHSAATLAINSTVDDTAVSFVAIGQQNPGPFNGNYSVPQHGPILGWSADSTKIYYISSVWSDGLSQYVHTLYSIEPDGNNNQTIYTTNNYGPMAVAGERDGKLWYIARPNYISGPGSGAGEIWYSDLNGANLTKLVGANLTNNWYGIQNLRVYGANDRIFWQEFIDGTYATIAIGWNNLTVYAPNDNFADAIELFGLSDTDTQFGAENATVELNEASHITTILTDAGLDIDGWNVPLYNSIWYKWTAPESGLVNVDSFSSSIYDTDWWYQGDTTLIAFTGTAVDNIQLISGTTSTIGPTQLLSINQQTIETDLTGLVSTNPSVLISRDTGKFRSGIASLNIKRDGIVDNSNTNTVRLDGSILHNDTTLGFPVTPGDEIGFSSFVATTIDHVNSIYGQVKIVYYDAQGNSLGWGPSNFALISNTDWAFVSIGANNYAPAEAVSAAVYVETMSLYDSADTLFATFYDVNSGWSSGARWSSGGGNIFDTNTNTFINPSPFDTTARWAIDVVTDYAPATPGDTGQIAFGQVNTLTPLLDENGDPISASIVGAGQIHINTFIDDTTNWGTAEIIFNSNMTSPPIELLTTNQQTIENVCHAFVLRHGWPKVISRSTNRAHTGTYSLILGSGTSTTGRPTIDINGPGPTINVDSANHRPTAWEVESGDAITFSAWINSTTTGNNGYLLARFWDSDFNSLGTQGTGDVPLTLANTWYQLSVNLVAPALSAWVTIEMGQDSTTKVTYYDDISFNATSRSGALLLGELLSPNQQNIETEVFSVFEATYDSIFRSDDYASNGSFSIKAIWDNNITLKSEDTYNAWPVVPGDIITFSCQARGEAGITNGLVNLNLLWLNAGGTQISSSSSDYSMDLSDSPNFELLTMTATAPANAAYVKPVVNPWAITAISYYDDFSLKKGLTDTFSNTSVAIQRMHDVWVDDISLTVSDTIYTSGGSGNHLLPVSFGGDWNHVADPTLDWYISHGTPLNENDVNGQVLFMANKNTTYYFAMGQQWTVPDPTTQLFSYTINLNLTPGAAGRKNSAGIIIPN